MCPPCLLSPITAKTSFASIVPLVVTPKKNVINYLNDLCLSQSSPGKEGPTTVRKPGESANNHPHACLVITGALKNQQPYSAACSKQDPMPHPFIIVLHPSGPTRELRYRRTRAVRTPPTLGRAFQSACLNVLPEKGSERCWLKNSRLLQKRHSERNNMPPPLITRRPRIVTRLANRLVSNPS